MECDFVQFFLVVGSKLKMSSEIKPLLKLNKELKTIELKNGGNQMLCKFGLFFSYLLKLLLNELCTFQVFFCKLIHLNHRFCFASHIDSVVKS